VSTQVRGARRVREAPRTEPTCAVCARCCFPLVCVSRIVSRETDSSAARVPAWERGNVRERREKRKGKGNDGQGGEAPTGETATGQRGSVHMSSSCCVRRACVSSPCSSPVPAELF
jgi:hypothetical protein